MKKFAITATLLTGIISSFAATGDYQLYRSSIWSKIEGRNIDRLCMINTTNGKVWYLDETLDDTGAEKKIISGWKSVEKDISDEEIKIKEKKEERLNKEKKNQDIKLNPLEKSEKSPNLR